MLRDSEISVWQVKGDTIHINHSILPSVTGTTYSATIDMVIQNVLPFYRDELSRLLKSEADGEYQYQFQIHEDGGISHWVEMHMRVKHAEGKVDKVGVFSNIDAVKHQEAELLEAHRRSFNALERENFINHMNHEIRTPLNAILGFSQLMCEPNSDLTEDDIKSFGDIIEENNEIILKLIEEMLTLAHLSYANVRLNIHDVPLNDIASQLAERYRPKVEEAGLAVMAFSEESDVTIRADVKVVNQICDCLIDNAIKFNKPGGTVSGACGVENGVPYISISDTGIGIAPDQQEFVFKRFFKVDSFSQGAGLGLALAQEYAHHMGCHIEVRSRVGVGSTFTLYFSNV